MVLKSITPIGIGPFNPPDPPASRHSIPFEDDVTVLTGANNVGKSQVLDLIELATCVAPSRHRLLKPNRQMLYTKGLAEDTDQARWVAEFAVDRTSLAHGLHFDGWERGGILQIQATLGRDGGRGEFRSSSGDPQPVRSSGFAQHPPKCLRVPPNETLRGSFALNEASDTERALMTLAFGGVITANHLSGHHGHERIRNAEAQLNEAISRSLPKGLSIEFQLSSEGDPASRLILFQNENGQTTLLEDSGAGLLKYLGIIVRLATADFAEGHGLVLLDEPENALHPDAQHALRTHLEQLAADPLRQVVYATHSPCMINPSRPSSVRLLTREAGQGRVTTVCRATAASDGWLPVRTALGMSLADSLHLADVAICVEGATEARALNIILDKCHAAGLAGFEPWGDLVGRVTIHDVNGENYRVTCQRLRDLGVSAVLLLDGDKSNDPRLVALRASCPDTPVVLLGDHQSTFEDLVPRSVYFEALAEAFETPAAQPEISLDAFEAWRKSNGALRPQRTFSSVVREWLEWLGYSPSKPAVMAAAAYRCDPREFKHTDGLVQLLKEASDLARVARA